MHAYSHTRLRKRGAGGSPAGGDGRTPMPQWVQSGNGTSRNCLLLHGARTGPGSAAAPSVAALLPLAPGVWAAAGAASVGGILSCGVSANCRIASTSGSCGPTRRARSVQCLNQYRMCLIPFRNDQTFWFLFCGSVCSSL